VTTVTIVLAATDVVLKTLRKSVELLSLK